MDFGPDLENRIRRGIESELPIHEAFEAMAVGRRDRMPPDPDQLLNAKTGAVLILVYPIGQAANMVFMKRPKYDGPHAGQISFPGGKVEEEDSDLIQTALREAFEEVGVIQKDVKVMGMGTSLYIPPSNFHVHPVIGLAPTRPEFIADPKEVDEIVEIPLHELLKLEEPVKHKIKLYNDMIIHAPGFQVNGHVIWGATGKMLNEFLHLIRRG